MASTGAGRGEAIAVVACLKRYNGYKRVGVLWGRVTPVSGSSGSGYIRGFVGRMWAVLGWTMGTLAGEGSSSGVRPYRGEVV